MVGTVSNVGALGWALWALVSGEIELGQVRPLGFVLILFITAIALAFVALWAARRSHDGASKAHP